jgi:hypothetical protein
VPSVPERLATAEADIRYLKERCDELDELLSGDGSDSGWRRSVRGRLHQMEGLQAAAASLEKSAADIKEARKARLDTWAQVLIVLTAVITAVCAVVGAVALLLP